MEKGTSWNSSSTKASNSENKTKQDVANRLLRLPRHKECVSPRPETRRKPPRSREVFDKRPRNRALCEKYRTEIVEKSASEPVTKQRGKKTNLNHLLNFTLKPTENRDLYGRRVTCSRSKLPKYNKELFLQANCQFVARQNGNYAIHKKNPDILVEWESIEEICIPTCEVPLCPICLYSPIAGKITRCGHIYCWPCILHYLALTDRMWQKCPICFEAVYKSELKSVSFKLYQPYAVGIDIEMCLMKRERESLRPVPSTHTTPVSSICNVDDDDKIKRFQKLLLADENNILSLIQREFSELQLAYGIEKDTPEACFIESALELLQERKKMWMTDEKIPITVPCSPKNWFVPSTVDHEDETGMDPNASSIWEKQKFRCMVEEHDLQEAEKIFFYQADDGQHIYLHNINVRMLLKEYGSLEHAPPFIKARIVEIEHAAISEILRKKFRHFRHLPLTCEFKMVELNLSGVISPATLLEFQSEINKRKNSRHRKARDERRREMCIELEEKKKIGKYPTATYNLESMNHFPAYDTDFYPSCSEPNVSSSHDFEIQPIPTTSFAQMLKDCPNKVFTQASKGKPGTSPHRELNEFSDEKISPPEYHQSFSDAIQAAFDSIAIHDDASATSPKHSKKKSKKKLLFTTSMYRNN